jgi:predicted GIY-YIG superfamily endonuclease
VVLAYSEQLPTLTAALRREKQIKRWTIAKKQAFIDDRVEDLKALSKRRTGRSVNVEGAINSTKP